MTISVCVCGGAGGGGGVVEGETGDAEQVSVAAVHISILGLERGAFIFHEESKMKERKKGEKKREGMNAEWTENG